MKIKTSLILPAVLCGVLASLSSPVRAEDTPPAAPAAPAAAAPAAPDAKGGGKGPRVDMVEQLAKELTLTEDQKTKLKPILDGRREKMKAVRQDTTLTDEQKKAKTQEVLDANTKEVKAILTPEQATKYDEFMAKMKDRRKGA